MKKTLSFFLCAVMVFAVIAHTVMAEGTPVTVTFVASEEGFEDKASIDGETITKNGVSVTFSKAGGNNPPVYYANGTAFRLYAKNTMTVTAEDSITSIVLTLGSSNTGTLGASVGEYTLSGSTGTWTGSSDSVVITNNASSGHARIQQITVTIGGSGSTQPDDPEYTTPEEILAAAYELSNGQTLAGGPYTLTGTVIEVNTPYYAPNNYITVTMAVEGLENMPIQCYKLVNGEATAIDKIAKNDIITVQGEIKNYNETVEFDSGCLLNGYTAGEHEEVTIYETFEEILAAAYELDPGAYLSEGHVYTLEGTITEINTAYSSEYKNITVTIEVDGVTAENNTIQCYRMVNGEDVEYVDQLKVNDHITVSGMIKKHNATVEFDAGCTLDDYTVGTHTEVPIYETPEEILAAAYELDPGAYLSEGHVYTLEGTITEINTAYSSEYKNITVTIEVDGVTAENNTIQCYRMVNGEDVEYVDQLKSGDHITVSGMIKKHNATVEFDAGCTLDAYEAAEVPTYNTPEEIVNALYELDPGATLPGGPYTLSGVITDVTKKYNAQYEDITVVMVVGDMTDKPVTCYYMINGEGVDGVSIIGVGDEITVKGELTHYQNNSGVSTYEFAKNCELTEFTAYPKFASKQLSLAGDLGVHFYMDLRSLPETTTLNTYMEFTVSGKTVTVGFDPENMNAAGEYYGFTCRVNVLQMAENIHAVFHYGDSTVETDYSVEEYIDYIFEHAGDYDAVTFNLVSAICNYGYSSQQYLHECNGVKLGENGYAAQHPSPYGINLQDDYSTIDAMEKTEELEGDAKFTYCLVLDSEITLELYVTVPDGKAFYGIQVFSDDETYDNYEDLGGGRFRVTIPGISATQLETWIQVNYAGTLVRHLCPLSYAAAVKNADISENASNWADSLAYLYYSAVAYANNN